MKHISKNSQKGMNYLHSFEIAKANNVNSLEKVYGRYSNEKHALSIFATFSASKKMQQATAI